MGSKLRAVGFAAMLLTAAGLVAASTSGCTIRARTPSVTVSGPRIATSYYTPLYYRGYVVYYDTVGRPVYYVNGVRYYVPRTYAYYGRYVSYYRRHRGAYRRWYRRRGYRYRRYRRRRGRRRRRVRGRRRRQRRRVRRRHRRRRRR
jgi:hypothetical protein